MHLVSPHRCRRSALLCCVTLVVCCLASPSSWAARLVDYEHASRVGLQRAWFAQIEVDRARDRVDHWVLHDQRLYAATSGGKLHVLNTETGETVWKTRIGQRDRTLLQPAASREQVAVINGSQLILLDGNDGRLLWSRQLDGAPAAGPALNEKYVFATLLNGRIAAYRIDEPNEPPWYYQSVGHVYLPPTASATVVTWSNDRGYFYVGNADELRVMFRMETGDQIATTPATITPHWYVAAMDGYVYSIDELSSHKQWRFSTGASITSKPVAAAGMVFVASGKSRLHAIDAVTGKAIWQAENVLQFVSLGQHHVYGADQRGRLTLLDRQTGNLMNRLELAADTTPIINDRSDRIFLVDPYGLVQCLHEVGTDQPIYYRQQMVDEEGDQPSSPVEENPFAAEPATDEPADDADDQPDEEENPFDDFDQFGE